MNRVGAASRGARCGGSVSASALPLLLLLAHSHTCTALVRPAIALHRSCGEQQCRLAPCSPRLELGDPAGSRAPPLEVAELDAQPAAQLEVWQAVVALNAATLIWGSQHAVIKDVVEAASPSSTNAARFLIAAAAALPWLPGAPWRAPSANATAAWTAGLELGCWSFLGFALQAVGLQYTTASRSAFLLYLNVKLVPLLALLLYGRQSPLRTWASAALALCGTALLSYDGGPPNLGDAWSVAAALASASFILRLEEAAGTAAPDEINAATIFTSALLTSAWAFAEVFLLEDGGGAPRALELATALGENALPLLYLALVTTAAAQWLQALGQSRVGANDAAVIYALDPVYAAGFSYLLLDETLGPQGIAGAGVVLSAVLLSRLPSSGGDGDEGGEPTLASEKGAEGEQVERSVS